MDRRKAASECTGSVTQPNAGRRSFIRRTVSALSAVLASAAAGRSNPDADETGSLKEQIDRLSNRLGMLQDTHAVRKLHHAYGYYLDKGIYEEVVNLFANDGEVFFNGGIFEGKDKGVRRLYVDYMGQGFMENNSGPVHGFLLDQTQEQDVVDIAPDRKSAKARFHCLMQVGARIVSDSPMMQMARLQGQGILLWWEGGIYENSYVRDGEVWRIRRLEYRTLWHADYALGWAYAKPGSIPPFSKTYPEDPVGPDKLIAAAAKAQLGAETAAFCYPHPVTGKLWKG